MKPRERECVVCGCTHLSDELNDLEARLLELAKSYAALNARATDLSCTNMDLRLELNEARDKIEYLEVLLEDECQ